MARIAGVDLPPNKQVWVGLTYIHGIGVSRSKDILRANKATLGGSTRLTLESARPTKPTWLNL